MKRNALAHQILAETPADLKQFVRRYAEITLRIQQILDEKGITQRELAEILGKKPSEISRWLRGNHNFTLASLVKLEVALGEDIFNITASKMLKVSDSLERLPVNPPIVRRQEAVC